MKSEGLGLRKWEWEWGVGVCFLGGGGVGGGPDKKLQSTRKVIKRAIVIEKILILIFESGCT